MINYLTVIIINLDMVLSDRDILRSMSRKEIGIEPFYEENLTSNGYDLSIKEIEIRDKQEKPREEALIPSSKSFLVSTREVIRVNQEHIGQIWVRSGYARKGLIGSFGLIDAGFEGELTLQFYNTGASLKLKRGDRIVQVMFERLDTPALLPYKLRSGRFMHQKGITTGAN